MLRISCGLKQPWKEEESNRETEEHLSLKSKEKVKEKEKEKDREEGEKRHLLLKGRENEERICYHAFRGPRPVAWGQISL